MEDQKRLSQDEFDMLQGLKQTGVEIATVLGELTYQQISLELQIEDQKNKLRIHKEKESIFFQNIREKYGNVILNIDTGTIN